MWGVATTAEFDGWFADLGEDAQRESSMAKSFDELVKRTTTKKTRQRGGTHAQLLGELLLSEIREWAGKSQRQVADALGIKQPSLSKLEKQSDMQISTLRRIVNALGGELEVSARFPAGTVKIEPFNEMGSAEAVSPY